MRCAGVVHRLPKQIRRQTAKSGAVEFRRQLGIEIANPEQPGEIIQPRHRDGELLGAAWPCRRYPVAFSLPQFLDR